MENQKETNAESEGTTPTEDAGDTPKASSLIDTAHAENERMEKNIKELREENDRKEEIAAKQMLGGTAEAGQEPVKKEETAQEYSKRILEGE